MAALGLFTLLQDCKYIVNPVVINTGIDWATSYLLSNKHVFIDREELNLACLCMEYLTLHCFDLDLPLQDLRKRISEGFYGFQEHAVAH